MKIPLLLILFCLSTHVLLAGGISLSYTDNSTNEDGFVIERKVDDGEFLEIARVPPDTEEYTDESPIVGAMNRYRVRAFNAFGYSGYTNESGKGAFVPDGAPSGLETTITVDLTVTVKSQ